jgi:hypothetical protein
LGDSSIYGRIILKSISSKQEVAVDLIQTGSEKDAVVGSCKHGNEIQVPKKDG